MAKVQFTHTSGRVETMEERFASILCKLGRGQYLTRDMRAVPLANNSPPAPQITVPNAGGVVESGPPAGDAPPPAAPPKPAGQIDANTAAGVKQPAPEPVRQPKPKTAKPKAEAE